MHHASKCQEELQEKFEQKRKDLLKSDMKEELLEKVNKLKDLEVALQEMYNNRGDQDLAKFHRSIYLELFLK